MFEIVSFVAIDADKITILRTKLTWNVPPGSATVAKYSKQILKLIYLCYLTALILSQS
jgi:hypothetical protein